MLMLRRGNVTVLVVESLMRRLGLKQLLKQRRRSSERASVKVGRGDGRGRGGAVGGCRKV